MLLPALMYWYVCIYTACIHNNAAPTCTYRICVHAAAIIMYQYTRAIVGVHALINNPVPTVGGRKWLLFRTATHGYVKKWTATHGPVREKMNETKKPLDLFCMLAWYYGSTFTRHRPAWGYINNSLGISQSLQSAVISKPPGNLRLRPTSLNLSLRPGTSFNFRPRSVTVSVC